MRRLSSLLALVVATSLPSSASAQVVIVFADGNRMEVQSYEVRENLVLFTTLEGKLRSVPRAYVDLAATEGGARESAREERPPRGPEPTPVVPQGPPAPRAPAPPVSQSAPRVAEPIESPVETVEAAPEIPPPADITAAPPPVWTNDELRVSLVVPSSGWKIEDLPPSFDVAVALENEATEARATLALIRRELRKRKAFQNVVSEVRSSISQAPGFRFIADGEIELDPYTSHEFRFVKTLGDSPSYNRLVVVFSRDLAYVLSLSCPEERRAENEAAFDALVRGLVVKKPRKELTF